MSFIRSIAQREMRSYFHSPMAYVFLVVFAGGAIFTFFNLQAFFSNGEANVRGFFESVPILAVILVPALTMRLWAEEAEQGTLETLLTMPVREVDLVLGKFLASWALLGVGLLLTLGLPLTVSSLGNLDWGPVIGGYVGAMLLGASYLAIGQFVSATTENQLLAFILAAAVCLAWYLMGWERFTQIFADGTGEILRKLGTGARFESIARGVIDLRDILYNISLTGFFLALTVAVLRIRRLS